MVAPKRREICDHSLQACRLLPIGKRPTSEQSIVNCSEMVATDSEQVLN